MGTYFIFQDLDPESDGSSFSYESGKSDYSDFEDSEVSEKSGNLGDMTCSSQNGARSSISPEEPRCISTDDIVQFCKVWRIRFVSCADIPEED